MGLLNVAVRGAFWVTLSTAIRSVVTLLRIAILTRFITKEEFGIVAIASLFIDFTQIFLDLGVSSGILHKQDITAKEYSSLFWLNIICGIILNAIILAITPAVANFYHEPRLLSILGWLSITIFISSLGSQHRTVQQKKLNFRYISIVEIVAALSSLALAVVMAVKGYGITSLVVSTIFHVAVTNILFLLIGLIRDRNISLHFNLKETFPFLKIGVFSVGTRILDYFSSEMDTIIISAFLGKETLGLYSLCKKLAKSLLGVINPIITKTLTPLMALIQKEKDKVRGVYYTIVETVGLTNFPIYFCLAGGSVCVLKILYGNQYIDGCWLFSMLSIYYGYISTGNPVGSLQVALGRTDSGFYWTICRIVVNSLAVLVGAQFGIYAIVVALFLVTVLSEPLSWLITIRPLIGGRFIEYFAYILKPMVFAGVTAIPVFFFLYRNERLSVFVFQGVVYAGVYLAAVMLIYKDSYLIKTMTSKYREFRNRR